MTEFQQPPEDFYSAVGGAVFFRALVQRFYAGVAQDPELRPMYPEEDLTGAEERLRMFLEQYWGGPRTYSDQRGHPRLRMRHAPFEVTLGDAGPLAGAHACGGRLARHAAAVRDGAVEVHGDGRAQHGQRGGLTGSSSQHPSAARSAAVTRRGRSASKSNGASVVRPRQYTRSSATISQSTTTVAAVTAETQVTAVIGSAR